MRGTQGVWIGTTSRCTRSLRTWPSWGWKNWTSATTRDCAIARKPPRCMSSSSSCSMLTHSGNISERTGWLSMTTNTSMRRSLVVWRRTCPPLQISSRVLRSVLPAKCHLLWACHQASTKSPRAESPRLACLSMIPCTVTCLGARMMCSQMAVKRRRSRRRLRLSHLISLSPSLNWFQRPK